MTTCCRRCLGTSRKAYRKGRFGCYSVRGRPPPFPQSFLAMPPTPSPPLVKVSASPSDRIDGRLPPTSGVPETLRLRLGLRARNHANETLVIGQIDVRPGVFVHPAWWKSLTLGLPTGGLSLALSRRHEAPNRGARRGACPESRRHSVSSALRKARPPPGPCPDNTGARGSRRGRLTVLERRHERGSRQQ